MRPPYLVVAHITSNNTGLPWWAFHLPSVSPLSTFVAFGNSHVIFLASPSDLLYVYKVAKDKRIAHIHNVCNHRRIQHRKMEEENQELVFNVSSVEKGLGGSVTEKLELTIDQVVEEYVGSFGFSQLVHVFLVSLAWIFDSQSTLVTIFADAQPDSWRCIGSSSSCAVGGIRSTGRAAAVCGLKPGSWQWVDGHESSTIAEWGLVCDRKFLAVIPASLYFIGSLIGSAIFGRLADAFLGRKGALLISCLLTSATNFLTSLSPNIWIYALLRFANGFSRSGIGICCLVLSTEVVGCHWRGQVGQYGFFFFTTGFLSLPIIAYPTRMHWRNLYRIISLLPVVYSIFILAPFVLESPRWLLGRGRSKEALYVLEKYARFNGKKLPVDHLCLSQPSRTAESSTKIGEIIRETSPRTLWNTSWAVKRMALLMIVGSGIGFVYYGIQLNVENLNFNLYFTVAMNALMEIPAVFIGSVLLGMANRRLILSGSAYIAGISSILCIIFSRSFSRENDDNNSGGSGAQMILEGIGLMAASTAFGVLYRYCVELFPTNMRSFAVSILRQALMLGAAMAPLLVAIGRLNPSLAFLIFGGLSIFSGSLSIWLPETRNSPIYETLEQQEEAEKQYFDTKPSEIQVN